MQNRSPFGHPMVGAAALDITALKALDVSQHMPYEQFVLSDGRRFYYHPSSVLTGDDIFVATPASSQAGRYLLAPGAVDLKLAIGFGTADAAVLATIPTGARFVPKEFFWEVTADFTGGAASAIGVSSNKAAPTSWVGKGDLLGGATGDVAATLVASGGMIAGTVGTDWDTIAKRRGAMWVAANNFLFDRITSAFTAGAGFVHIEGSLIANAGA